MITMSVKRTKQLQSILERFPRESEKETDAWLDKNARALISSSGKVPGLVQVSPPFSEGPKTTDAAGNVTSKRMKGGDAKKQGESAVMRDIWKVYATPSKIYEVLAKADPWKAKAWYALWKRDKAKSLAFLQKNAPASIRALSLGFDNGAAHIAARGKNGRVKGGYRAIVTSSAAVKRYVKTRQKNVGTLAASVPKAAGSSFGALKGVPKWISTKGSRYGYARRSKSGKRKSVTFGVTNSSVADMQRRFDYALGYRFKAMERELPYIARSLEKRLRSRL